MTVRSWSLPPERVSRFPTPPDLVERRSSVAASASPAPAAGITVHEMVHGGVCCRVCEPKTPNQTLLYLHGGGYRLGAAERSAPFATRLARAARARVVVADYRLAPEHPFPAGIRDAAAVYEALLAQGHEGIVAIGDSAGGGLAAALTVACASSNIPLPRALVLMSPWLDLTCDADTFHSRAASDQLFSLAAAQEAAHMYLQGHEATDPLASPGRAPLDGWPPCLLFASTDEVLLYDSVAFTSALALARVPVTAYFEPGKPHAWPAVFPDLPDTDAALEIVGRFLHRQ
jgi:epsilon-lactone hydrolase